MQLLTSVWILEFQRSFGTEGKCSEVVNAACQPCGSRCPRSGRTDHFAVACRFTPCGLVARLDFDVTHCKPAAEEVTRAHTEKLSNWVPQRRQCNDNFLRNQ